MEKSKIKINLFKDLNKNGIWRYFSYLNPIKENFLISLDEGNTPIIDLDPGIFLKREDLNPTGSLKDRGMAYLISFALSQGEKNLALSSSGNAAISAAAFCQKAGINLKVFISPNIKKEKLQEIQKYKVSIVESSRPISDCAKFCSQNKFLNLRPSAHPRGTEGYQTIAFEIAEQVGLIENIFIPVSSGVAFVGIFEGFQKIGILPRFHLCQSSFLCPIASLFEKDYQPEKVNLTDALVARFTPLKQKILEIINQSNGTGWVIEGKDIKKASALLQKKGISTSFEGALTYAAFLKAKTKDKNLNNSVCLLTGKKY